MDDVKQPAAPALEVHPLSQIANAPKIDVLDLAPPGPFVLGRSSEADWQVSDQAISRRHALMESFDGAWYVSDLSSRHGTFVNGRRVPSGQRTPIRSGDTIKLGEWSCRVRDPREAPVTLMAAPTGARDRDRVSSIGDVGFSGVAQLRLNILMKASRELSATDEIEQVAKIVSRGAAEGSNCARAFVVRQESEVEFEIFGADGETPTVELSRSLLAAAAEGETVQLTGDMNSVPQGQSIIDLGIQTAICSPILVGGMAELFLYLDTRGSERRLANDSAAFCQALTQLAGTAIERIHRNAIEEHWKQLERDLTAARRAQELLLPPRTGKVANLHYAFESEAGRMVAGDLFDLFALDDSRAAFFLGDVAGKGVGAAVLMAATQSQLRTLLQETGDPVVSVANVSRYLVDRTESSKFITLIAGVIDTESEQLLLVDAGHGFGCVHRPGEAPMLIKSEGSFPLGVMDQGDYTSVTVPFPTGSRVIVFSDGVVEQVDSSGVQFGVERVLDVLASCDEPRADAERLKQAVSEHAGGAFADDITIASMASGGD